MAAANGMHLDAVIPCQEYVSSGRIWVILAIWGRSGIEKLREIKVKVFLQRDH
jgi:hypothetical protein